MNDAEFCPVIGGPQNRKWIATHSHNETMYAIELVELPARQPPTRKRSIPERLFSLPWRPTQTHEYLPIGPMPTRKTIYHRMRMFSPSGESRSFWVHESVSHDEAIARIKDSRELTYYLHTGRQMEKSDA